MGAWRQRDEARRSGRADASTNEAGVLPLRGQDELLRSVVEAAADGIFLLDDGGVILMANPAAAETFGVDRDALAGRPLSSMLTAPFAAYFGYYLEQSRSDSSRASRVREVLGRAADGSTVPLRLSLVPLNMPVGPRYWVMVSNLTAIKAAEERLRRAQKLESLGSLASSVAHDFNNVLMGVGGCIDIALDALDRHSPARQYLEEIQLLVRNGSSVTRQLLSFSRESEERPRVFQLSDFVDDHIQLLGRLLGEGVMVTAEHAGDDTRVRVDLGLLEQVLMNLASNARDAMPQGGILELATRRVSIGDRRAAELQLCAGDYVLWTIADTGVGMAPEVKESIFEPFFTTKSGDRGTGLGLSTALGVVRDAEGTIEVRSAPGQGTKFSIYLPLVSEQVTEHFEPGEKEDRQHGAETVLVVEDARWVRAAVRHYLEGAGYRVLEARSGEEALAWCRDYGGPIDLVISDVVLPDRDGAAVVTEVLEGRPRTRILLMTAHRGTSEQGMDTMPLLHKPFGRDELLREVDRLFRRRDTTVSGLFENPPKLGSKAAGHSHRVLLVDDQAATRLAFAALLSRRGWEVRCASSGIEALEMALAEAPDVILTDVGLPDMRGDALARSLAEVHELQDVPVIYMSGFETQELDPPAPLLVKPFDPEQLIEVLDEVVR